MQYTQTSIYSFSYTFHRKFRLCRFSSAFMKPAVFQSKSLGTWILSERLLLVTNNILLQRYMWNFPRNTFSSTLAYMLLCWYVQTKRITVYAYRVCSFDHVTDTSKRNVYFICAFLLNRLPAMILDLWRAATKEMPKQIRRMPAAFRILEKKLEPDHNVFPRTRRYECVFTVVPTTFRLQHMGVKFPSYVLLARNSITRTFVRGGCKTEIWENVKKIIKKDKIKYTIKK